MFFCLLLFEGTLGYIILQRYKVIKIKVFVTIFSR
jgi:hypothetical protein